MRDRAWQTPKPPKHVLARRWKDFCSLWNIRGFISCQDTSECLIGMLSLSHWINITRCDLLPVACLMIAATPWSATPQVARQISGTWRGNSVCAVPDTPCHNEVNVYRFSEIEGKVNRFSRTASKIVNGKVVMGRANGPRFLKAEASNGHFEPGDSA